MVWSRVFDLPSHRTPPSSVSGMVSERLAFVSVLILSALVVGLLIFAYVNPVRGFLFFPGAQFANISGFVALFLIAGTGVLMFFRRPLLRITRDPDSLREVHVIVAGLGGLFLIVHISFLLFFPISLAVLFGYLGSYAAFVVWVTGVIFIEGFRSSLFYHSLLSLVAVALMIVHVFAAGRNLPVFASGIVLVIIAAVVLVGAANEAANLPRTGQAPRA